MVKRTAAVGSVIEEPPGEAHGHEHEHWRWTPIAAGTPLRPGQLVRIREEVALAEAQSEVHWSQFVPPTCAPLVRSPVPIRPIGAQEPGGGHRLTFRAAELKAGTHVHEYLLEAVRPGTCLLPAPELRAGGKPLPVRTDPAELRLTVAESR
jgi:hypothetical protein